MNTSKLFGFENLRGISQSLATHSAYLHIVFHLLKTFAKFRDNFIEIESKNGKTCWKNEFFEKIIFERAKSWTAMNAFLLKCWGLSVAKAFKSCRSRQELSNEYLLAKIGVDTAENEPLKVWVSLFNSKRDLRNTQFTEMQQYLAVLHIFWN